MVSFLFLIHVITQVSKCSSQYVICSNARCKGELFFAREPFCLYFHSPFGNRLKWNEIDCEQCIPTCYIGTLGQALKYFFQVLTVHTVWLFTLPCKLDHPFQVTWKGISNFIFCDIIFNSVSLVVCYSPPEIVQAFKFCHFRILCWHDTAKAEWGVFSWQWLLREEMWGYIYSTCQ